MSLFPILSDGLVRVERWLSRLLERHGQSGQTQGMLASMLVGAVLIVLGLTLGGVL